ncbi:MAG TPA: hypothetical protein VLW53_19275 [Candidatus Eisenbacteria bacterium]|nr:hypothetical protein [Candidatus Eisenbacteria bacterium]
MTAAKPIAAATIATALVATASAMAQPAGSEYLPKLPKAGHHSSSGGQSPSSTTSSGIPATVTESTATSAPGPRRHRGPTHRRHRRHPKVARAKIASASPDTAGGSDLLPLALLLAVGGIVLLAGGVLRRQHTRRLAYRAERHRKPIPPTPPVAEIAKPKGETG